MISTSSGNAASPSRHAPSPSITSRNGKTYELNLIDTPGHVDFHYEVSRSLAACEGALLLVDAFQGVQAQTVANAYAAIEARPGDHPGRQQDRPAGHPDRRSPRRSRNQSWASTPPTPCCICAKTGIGIEEVFEAIIERIPPPQGRPNAPLKALVFDSKYDHFAGVMTYVRVDRRQAQSGGESQIHAAAAACTKSSKSASSVPRMTPLRSTRSRAGRLHAHRRRRKSPGFTSATR